MPKQVYTPEYQAFLSRLKDARRRAGLTQAQAAEKLGKPQSYVSKSESGERRVDAIEASQFAHLYGIRLEQLIGEDAQP